MAVLFHKKGSCGPSDSGPHSTDCLNSLWLDAGCQLTGSQSPSGLSEDEFAWWRGRKVGEVQEEMAMYYEQAMNGDTDFIAGCFGAYCIKCLT